MDTFHYDIISSDSHGNDQYEGTIRFFKKDIPFKDMYDEACLAKNYPILPLRENVRFILQGTPEWKRIINSFKQ